MIKFGLTFLLVRQSCRQLANSLHLFSQHCCSTRMGGWGGTDRLEKSPHLTPMATGRKTAERKGGGEGKFCLLRARIFWTGLLFPPYLSELGKRPFSKSSQRASELLNWVPALLFRKSYSSFSRKQCIKNRSILCRRTFFRGKKERRNRTLVADAQKGREASLISIRSAGGGRY